MARSVLLVEQEPRLLHFTAYQLRSLDLEPVAVTSLKRAREVARTRRFDLWIVDAQDVDLRLGDQCESLPDVPLILLSDRVTRSQQQTLPGGQVLSKPFKLAQLSEAVNRALGVEADEWRNRPARY